MNIKTGWEDDAKTIMRYSYSGDWDWDKFYKHLEWRDPHTPTDGSVIMLIDFRGVTRFPSDAILHLKRAAKMAEETHELIILICDSPALMTLFNLFIKMYSSVGKRFRLVTDDEGAYALLKIPSENG